MKSDYSKWLDAGKIATFFRIPVMVYLVFLIWVIKPSVVLLLLFIAHLAVYRVLAIFGYTLTVLLQRILHWLRGNNVSGRPWWYRKFFE